MVSLRSILRMLVLAWLTWLYCVEAAVHATEMLVEEDRGNIIDTMPPDDTVSAPCHVEFQVMKRIVGRCVKLGRSSRGCVAGTYVHPFHPECL